MNPAGEKLFTDFNIHLNEALPQGAGYETFIALLNETRALQQPKSGEVQWPDQRTFAALISPIEDGGQVAIAIAAWLAMACSRRRWSVLK